MSQSEFNRALTWLLRHKYIPELAGAWSTEGQYRGVVTMWSPSTLCPVPVAGVGLWKGRVGSSAVTIGWVSPGAGQGLLKLPLVILPAAMRLECRGKLRHGWGN